MPKYEPKLLLAKERFDQRYFRKYTESDWTCMFLGALHYLTWKALSDRLEKKVTLLGGSSHILFRGQLFTWRDDDPNTEGPK